MQTLTMELIEIHFRTAMTVRCLLWISATNQSPATLRAMIPDIAMIFCLRYLVFVVFWQPPTMHHWRSINRRCARNANICKKLLNRCPVAVFDGFAQDISINQSHVILHLFQHLFGISLTFRSGLVWSQPGAQSAFPITASGRSSKITAFSAGILSRRW